MLERAYQNAQAKRLLQAGVALADLWRVDVRGELGTCTVAQQFPDGRCNLGLMGRERATFTGSGPTYIWGVYVTPTALYASDMLNGLWKVSVGTR